MAQNMWPLGAAVLLEQQLPKGIFLCVGGEPRNVMTIGWGGLSFFWNRDVFIAAVRPQRFTYDILMRERAFTVCVPAPGGMLEQVRKAGVLSGRDGDKFSLLGLRTRPGRGVNAPVIEGCALTLECRVLATNAFTNEGTDPSIIEYTYQAGDFHTLFYSEIAACYAGDAP